jgi:ribosomal 50S subunit-recycling heat shock protein
MPPSVERGTSQPAVPVPVPVPVPVTVTVTVTGSTASCTAHKAGAAYCARMDKLRIDKWLWAARFHKTRSLATDELNKGRVLVNGQVAKPSREVKPGDLVTVRSGPVVRTVKVWA